MCLCSVRARAYCTGGNPSSGSESGGSGVTIFCFETFTVDSFSLPEPDDDADDEEAFVREKLFRKLKIEISEY